LPFFTAENISAEVSFMMAGSEADFTPIALAIPALGVPVAPWHTAHLVL
jgi:hypothetical protein